MLRPSSELPGWLCTECGVKAPWQGKHVCVFRFRYVDPQRGTYYVYAATEREAVDKLVGHLKAIKLSGVEPIRLYSEPVSIVEGRLAPGAA